MVSDRLRGIIDKKLSEDLSHVEIIEYKGEIWFIDREDKFWYFIYNKSNGEMWWRYSFFTPFFSLFSLSSDKFTFILSSWVEDTLNCKVTTTRIDAFTTSKQVEEVLNCKVTTTNGNSLHYLNLVEEVLNCKVTTTEFSDEEITHEVVEVLSSKVNTISTMEGALYNTVERVLNNGVTE
jgi:hypothetical protein